MARFKLNSLRWRLLLLVALAIAPLVAMTIAAGIREREHALASARENLQRLANLAGANEAQSLESAMQILRDLSSVPAVAGKGAGCAELMADILSKNTDFVNFGVIELDGTVSCSAVEPAVPVNLGDRPHFQRAVAERRFVAGNYVFGRVIRKHTVNVTYPVIKRDKVVAVLFAAFDLSELDKFVADIELPDGSVLWTLDEEGTVISRRPDRANWIGKKMTDAAVRLAATRHAQAVLVDADGVERLYASARVGPHSLSNYTVLIGVPEDEILADARRDQRFAIAGLVTTVLLAGLAAWWGGEILIVRRVRALARTANLIASGSLSTRTGIRYGNEEISELARSLDEMARSLEIKEVERDLAEEQLVAADKRKDEFLAMLAHELRNPLAPICAGAQLLRETQAGNPVVASTAAIISRQADHMTRLVDDLLDVSRVTRGLVKLDREALDFRTIVHDAAEQIRPLIARKRQQLTLDLPQLACMVGGDRKRMVQVAGNLINNAAKYTPNGGHIKVTLAARHGQATLTVADDGIGMAPGLVPTVFDLFTQGERTSDRSQGGLGLGLALVKTLVRLHGGSVRADSAGLGLGSTFTVEIPELTGAAAPRHSGTAGRQAAAAVRTCCLVVDDNVDAADTLAMFLKGKGHEVVVAHNSSDALALARAHAPKVCLLDIGLPDLDGNALVGLLRRSVAMESALMIAVSGYGRQEDREKALAAGFDHYFVKPLDTAALNALMAAQLGAQAAR
jgi:signal transduction histidine kinase/CheY-like chemotaxis protein